MLHIHRNDITLAELANVILLLVGFDEFFGVKRVGFHVWKIFILFHFTRLSKNK